MPRVRFRLSTFLILVAATGLTLGGKEMARRREQHLQHARILKRRYSVHMELIAKARANYKQTDQQDAYQIEKLAMQQEMVVYLQQLTEKYELAASRPWAAVEPDPPSPGDLWNRRNGIDIDRLRREAKPIKCLS